MKKMWSRHEKLTDVFVRCGTRGREKIVCWICFILLDFFFLFGGGVHFILFYFILLTYSTFTMLC